MKNCHFHFVGNLLSLCTLSISLLFSTAYGQRHKFPPQDSSHSYNSSFIFTAPNNNLLYFWYNGTTLQQARSTDNGINWGSSIQLADSLSDLDSLRDINCFTTSTGRLLLLYKKTYYMLRYSDDNGYTWSSPNKLVTGINLINSRNSYAGNFAQSSSGKIFLLYSRYSTTVQNVSYIASTDNGLTWSAQNVILSGPGYGSIVPLNGSNLMLFYQNNGIYYAQSSDDGITWQNNSVVIGETSVFAPRAIKDQSGRIWLFYVNNSATPFNNITQTDIMYRTTTDNGISWSPDSNFTKYKGMDNFYSISNNANNPILSFASNRYNGKLDQYNIWYGTAGVSDDINTPPYMYQYVVSNLPPQTPVKFSVYVDYNYPLTTVDLNITQNGTMISPVSMHDDGLLGDSIANDKIYTGLVSGINKGDYLSTSFTIKDQMGNAINANGPSITLPIDNTSVSQLIEINNFKLPINNSGVLADVLIPPAQIAGGMLDNKIVLYSAGFYLTGYSNGTLWANGMASDARVSDYLPGKVGSSPIDPKNIIYVLRSSDPDFGPSWQNWTFAVSQGADFYDGDHDGIYNPVDKNGNGKWDPEEDRPANLGDITAWCVYNDGLQSDLRTFNDVQPQGIEIHQTVFAKSSTSNLGNIVFVEYRIINTGTKSDKLDSVYFSAFADPDIGDNGSNDLDGCDTLLNAVYTYHSGSSVKWGNTPPAFFISGLQGPLSYIPGITFIDNNTNGIYDDGIDTPLDTAYNRKGLAGIQNYPGAINSGTSSFRQILNGSDPPTRYILRNYTLGLDSYGNQTNPCTWPQGSVLGGINCSAVNPLFMYSGDPVTNIGWLNNVAADQRFISNYGPFQLRKNQPVDIILAYVIGKGSDALNSVSVARNITSTAKDYYASNFNGTFTSVLDKNNSVINTFRLEQNYPNPFNPNTKIKYSLPVDSHIKLIIYNTIGQVVKILVNDIQKTGSHELNFNAASLSSGVYFYTIQSTSIDGKQNYTSTKKMILLK